MFDSEIDPFKELEKRPLEIEGDDEKIVLHSRGTDWIVTYLQRETGNSWNANYTHMFSHYRPAFLFYSSVNCLQDFKDSF